MGSPYESQLRDRGQKFVDLLRENKFSASIIEESIRDYSIKIDIGFEDKLLGRVIIYYSPKKNAFRAEFGELRDKAYLDSLQDLWHNDVSQKGICLYTDGSFISGSNCVGWSVVIVNDGQLVETLSGSLTDVSMNQVIGELEAAKRAVLWCKSKHINKATIAHDYAGIGCWATGEWEAKETSTMEYVSFINAHTKSLSINWLKVDAHSGNRWNEQADELAKQACR